MFLRLFTLLILLISKTAMAGYSWVLYPSHAVEASNMEELRKIWPSINSNTELNSLLRTLSSYNTFDKVRATLQGNEIQIAVEQAYTIERISVHSTTREFKKNILTLMHIYRNQVDSAETRKRIKEDALRYLNTIGFLKATVTITSHPINQRKTKLIVSVDEDYPCLVRDLQFGFKVPKGISFPMTVGSVCNSQELESALRNLKEALALEGYNQHRILPPEIRFDPPSNSALIYIPGKIGKKITSRVRSNLSNTPFIRAILGDELHTLDNSITDPNTMSSEIIKKFKDAGYQDVKSSEAMKSKPSKNEIMYTFDVTPGPEYKIIEVQIEGLTAIGLDKALETMGLHQSFGNSPLLTEQNIRRSLDSLSSLYSDLGYWDAKVYYPKIKKNPINQEAKLKFVSTEGKRRVLEGVLVRGNRALSETDIRDMLNAEQQDALTYKSIVDFQQNLERAYRDIGYLYTKIKIDLLQNRRFRDIQTRVSITIDEGPRVKIGKIEIKGLIKTNRYVVERELKFSEGDWYSPSDIDDSRQALIDLGLFSSLTISATDSSDFSKEELVIPYTVSVREAKPGQVSFGPGWSLQDGGRFSVDSSYNNIEGTGRQAFLNASYSEEVSKEPIDNRRLLGYNLGLGYIEPYILNIPANGILTLSQSAEANDKQWELSKSIQATLSHSYWLSSKKLKTELFTLYKITQEEAAADVSTLLNTDEIQIRELGLRSIWDTRNNVGWPTEGAVISAETSWADLILGGDTKYFHWIAKSSNYFQLAKSLVFATRTALESFTNVIRSGSNLNILPSSERIQSGGPESNRGFKQGALGPIVRYTDIEGVTQEIKIGGSQSLSLTLELRLKMSESFGMTIFLDNSNTFLTPTETSLFTQALNRSSLSNAELLDNFSYDFSDLLYDPSLIWKDHYSSYGLSASYLTPLGSINISYGFPFDRCPSQRECSAPRGNQQYKKLRGGQLQINVGTNF